MERIIDVTHSLLFGIVMNNFGVQLFIDKFYDMGTIPMDGTAILGDTPTKKKKGASNDEDESTDMIQPSNEAFIGFVLKNQAILNPKHRD